MTDEPHAFEEINRLNEQLSAYIDGELSSDEREILEKRLDADEPLRRHLEGLKNNWSLLEQLPRENAPSRFTASTVGMVAIRAEAYQTPDDHAAGWHIRFFPRWLLILCAASLAGSFGYNATKTITNNVPVNGLLETRNVFLLQNLNFLEHFPEYYQLGENIEFLKNIYKLKYFSSRTQVAADPSIVRQAQNSEEQARARIHSMDSGRKKQLLTSYLGFLQLPEKEQGRLLNLHADLVSAPNAEILSKALITYTRWYQQRDPLEQVEITLRTQSEKIEYIQHLVASPPVNAKYFSGNDFSIVTRWLEDVAKRNEKKLLRSVGKNRSVAISRLTDHERSRQLVFLLVKKSNRNQIFLSNPVERKHYGVMKARLSESFQKTLVNQPSINDEIVLLVEMVRRDFRDNRFRTMERDKRQSND